MNWLVNLMFQHNPVNGKNIFAENVKKLFVSLILKEDLEVNKSVSIPRLRQFTKGVNRQD